MKEIGLEVDTAEDGTDAVNIMSSAEGRKYDLIFMDIQMPKMDGYTATREIRTLNNHKCANIPIIAMTANAFEEDRKKAVKAGMNGHIAKPISADVILENLDQDFWRIKKNKNRFWQITYISVKYNWYLCKMDFKISEKSGRMKRDYD